MEVVERLWAQGYSNMQMMGPVNTHMQAQGLPPVSVRTIKRDKQRLMQQFDGENEDVRSEHIEALKLVKRKAWEDHDGTPEGSPNRSSYLNTIRATEETIAKLDGSYSTKISIEGAVQVNQVSAILMEVLVAKLSPEVAEDVLTAFSQRVATAEVIDAK